jgi:hypothetical protein
MVARTKCYIQVWEANQKNWTLIAQGRDIALGQCPGVSTLQSITYIDERLDRCLEALVPQIHCILYCVRTAMKFAMITQTVQCRVGCFSNAKEERKKEQTTRVLDASCMLLNRSSSVFVRKGRGCGARSDSYGSNQIVSSIIAQ